MNDGRYYERLAAAYLRGYAMRTNAGFLSGALLDKNLDELTEEDLAEVIEAGRKAQAKLYAFKNTHGLMPRVNRVMGFLKSQQFGSLLDVGSGRGVFLFPFLETFPGAWVTSVDILPHRVEFLQDLRRGGVERLRAVEADICTMPFPQGAFDVVTMLEVLEHIPDVEAAVRAAVRMAGKYVVVTVPSKPDHNPEHIHLLTKSVLTGIFEQAGCRRLRFDGVNGHLFMVATIGGMDDE